MAYSTQRTTSDGTLDLIDISIVYFDRSEIAVLFDGVVQTTGWSWVGTTEKKIAFSPDVPNGVEVMLVRTTDLSKPRHIFTLGAKFDTQSMDEDIRQILHIAQEAKENATIEEVFHNLNMHGYRIVNVGAGIDPTDAPNMQQMVVHDAVIVAYRDATLGYRNEAQGFRDEAADFAATASAAAITQVNAGATKAVLKSSNTASALIPSGLTADRDAVPVDGMFRLNLTLGKFEGYRSGAWGSIGGGATGGASDDVFYENAAIVTANYTITSGKNAGTFGPIVVNDGVTITVPDGATWSIV